MHRFSAHASSFLGSRSVNSRAVAAVAVALSLSLPTRAAASLPLGTSITRTCTLDVSYTHTGAPDHDGDTETVDFARVGLYDVTRVQPGKEFKDIGDNVVFPEGRPVLDEFVGCPNLPDTIQPGGGDPATAADMHSESPWTQALASRGRYLVWTTHYHRVSHWVAAGQRGWVVDSEGFDYAHELLHVEDECMALVESGLAIAGGGVTGHVFFDGQEFGPDGFFAGRPGGLLTTAAKSEFNFSFDPGTHHVVGPSAQVRFSPCPASGPPQLVLLRGELDSIGSSAQGDRLRVDFRGGSVTTPRAKNVRLIVGLSPRVLTVIGAFVSKPVTVKVGRLRLKVSPLLCAHVRLGKHPRKLPCNPNTVT